MKIRAGYEISYDCPQPAPMILTLSVYPLRSWGRITYHDSFGNFCHVTRASAGRLTMCTDFLVQDNGEPARSTRRRNSMPWKLCRRRS